ncbi:SET domain-containing protein, partial [Hysterangium stoloniferum]
SVAQKDREVIPAVSSVKRPSYTRKELERLWSTRAGEEGAAPIFFVNDVNDEEIPMLDPKKFIYLESQYLYNISDGPPDDGFMQSCECRTCNASLCSCQDDSEILDEEETRTFAYSGGLFTFDTLTNYVIECNKRCQCDRNCPSRVAQRPRAFPIQIFRTERCGWGVRAAVSLPKGSVLGVYTGDRKVTSELDTGRASYVFNLDFHEDVRDPSSGYAVDAYSCGNWTRFINHSCDPVCSHYPVVWDSVPMMHQPKMAFVANRDIPAKTELTIDYCPQARKGKGKARTKVPSTPDCVCGARNCRGFIYLK